VHTLFTYECCNFVAMSLETVATRKNIGYTTMVAGT